ncbi:hypothetical protein VTH82DRAFT_2199 [Thermothelomyces myriococcoides]
MWQHPKGNNNGTPGGYDGENAAPRSWANGTRGTWLGVDQTKNDTEPWEGPCAPKFPSRIQGGNVTGTLSGRLPASQFVYCDA